MDGWILDIRCLSVAVVSILVTWIWFPLPEFGRIPVTNNKS